MSFVNGHQLRLWSQLQFGMSCHTDSDAQNQLLQAVEGELKSEPKVKEKQLNLLSAITSDVSELSKELLKKLNCGPKR